VADYYMLESWGLGNGEPLQEPESRRIKINGQALRWMIGQKFSVQVPTPIELQWSDEISGGGVAWEMDPHPSEGPRSESAIRRLWVYKNSHPPLFHRKIVDLLKDCGVDNIDVYETSVADMNSGHACTDYMAVNIVGAVRAADMSRSSAKEFSEDGLVDTDFDSLVLDPQKALGFMLFRLAESINGIVVHRSIKKRIESEGGFDLRFIDPVDWIG